MVKQKNVDLIIEENMMGYSAYVLLNRALPRLEDGLKPIHRKILYTMHRDKATRFTKSANVSGSVMKLSPHGDCYETIVKMVQVDRHINPFVIGKGNFSQATSRDLQAGASRYTEVMLSPLAIDSMQNFDKNIVNFIDNYDGTLQMPEVLPVKFPNILIMANSGIGVGMASNSPSFNMNEVVNAVISRIETGKHSILVPDFATGGYIVNDLEAFTQINTEGTGSFILRGNATINKNEIEITEIPYTTTREAIIDKIVTLTKAGKLPITNVQDLTGLKGQRILVTAKRGTDMEELVNTLYNVTTLQSSFSANMNILVDNLPKVVGVHEIIDRWIIWRKECIVRGLKHDLQNMERKLHILKGLEKILASIDDVVRIIRFEDENLIDGILMRQYALSQEQVNEVSKMRLRELNKMSILSKTQEIKNLENSILQYNQIIESDQTLNNIIIKGLKETVEKFGSERRTQII
jgi:DNA gyrase subunit A